MIQTAAPHAQGLRIHIGPVGAGGRAVRIDNRRPLRAMRLFEGRDARQTLQSLPLLFGLCGHAQRAAAADALRAALPLAPEARHALRRRVRLETVREHLLHIHRDWQPPGVGRGEELAQLVRLTHAAADDAGAHATLRDWVARNTLGLAPDTLLGIGTVDTLRDWARAGNGVAARGLQTLFDTACALPCIRLPALEHVEPATLLPQLAGDDDLGFVARPDAAGTCLETGPAARRRDHPLIAAAAAHGMLHRVAARLVELCALLAGADAPDDSPPAHGDGLGWVDSARGRLLHYAEVDKRHRVVRYRILAPTEWNAHPRGIAVRLLAGLPDADDATVRRQAALILGAVDPCVQAVVDVAAVSPAPSHA